MRFIRHFEEKANCQKCLNYSKRIRGKSFRTLKIRVLYFDQYKLIYRNCQNYWNISNSVVTFQYKVKKNKRKRRNANYEETARITFPFGVQEISFLYFSSFFFFPPSSLFLLSKLQAIFLIFIQPLLRYWIADSRGQGTWSLRDYSRISSSRERSFLFHQFTSAILARLLAREFYGACFTFLPRNFLLRTKIVAAIVLFVSRKSIEEVFQKEFQPLIFQCN